MSIRADVKGALNDLAAQLLDDYNAIVENNIDEDENEMWNHLMREIESYSE